MRARSLDAIAAGALCLLLVARATADELPRRPVLGAGVATESGGARVEFIVPGSPADKAGVKTGDIVESIADHPVRSAGELIAAVRAAPVEQPQALQIVRAGAVQSLSVTLVPAPKEADPAVDTIYSSITVEGTLRRILLTTPHADRQRLPALLMVGGIGCFTIDNPNDPYDAYRLLARDLARAGIVAMRVEKSGIGDSQGRACFETGFDAEAKSYGIALDALRSDPHVDAQRVFLFGHSIGSVIVPRLAQDAPVAGIIFAEGVGRNWFEYELRNFRRQTELDGDSPAEADAGVRSKEICMHRLLVEHQSESDIEHEMPECKTRNKYPVAAAYMQEVAALDIVEPWMHVGVPVLGIYGTADFVTEEADHRRIVAIVNARHPGTATLHTIDGMDHHLGAAGSPQAGYDLRVKNHKEAPYEARFSAEVSTWICAHVHCG